MLAPNLGLRLSEIPTVTGFGPQLLILAAGMLLVAIGILSLPSEGPHTPGG